MNNFACVILKEDIGKGLEKSPFILSSHAWVLGEEVTGRRHTRSVTKLSVQMGVYVCHGWDSTANRRVTIHILCPPACLKHRSHSTGHSLQVIVLPF